MVGTYACEQNDTTAVSQMQTWYNCTNLFNQIKLLVMKYDEFNIPGTFIKYMSHKTDYAQISKICVLASFERAKDSIVEKQWLYIRYDN